MKRNPLYASFVIMISILGSCMSSNDDLISKALIDAGENAFNIQYVLDYYNDERRDIAEWMVSFMNGHYGVYGEGVDSIECLYSKLPNNGSWDFDSTQLSKAREFYKLPYEIKNDVSFVDYKYLISQINTAWNIRSNVAWCSKLSTEEFCELILPYRIGDEKLTYWRDAYSRLYDKISMKVKESKNSVDAARIISEAIGEVHYNIQLKNPHRSALSLLENPIGYCRDDCDRTIFAMRAFGVPVAVDVLLASPDNGTSHEWNVVYDTDAGIYRMFDNNRFLPTRDSLHNDNRRKGKVYRRTWSINFDRLEKYKNISNIPEELLNPYLKDVTAQYFGKNKVSIDVDGENIVFLGVFTPEGYKPIDMAERNGEKVEFIDIEPKVIYFPVSREQNSANDFLPCGMPFLVKSDGTIHEFIPQEDSIENIVVNRKIAVWFHQKERFSFFVGCKMQLGKTAFGPWRDIDSIQKPFKSSFYRIPLSDYRGEHFMRFLASKYQRCQLSEMIVSTDTLAYDRLPLTLITDEPEIGKDVLIDGDILKWVKYNKHHMPLVFRIDSDKIPKNIFVVSRNDDNYVMPREEYELFYFSRNGWKSLGKKIADDFKISFNAPFNSVLWLRNLTKGKEEQIFIWKNGKQIFNTNMSESNVF